MLSGSRGCIASEHRTNTHVCCMTPRPSHMHNTNDTGAYTESVPAPRWKTAADRWKRPRRDHLCEETTESWLLDGDLARSAPRFMQVMPQSRHWKASTRSARLAPRTVKDLPFTRLELGVSSKLRSDAGQSLHFAPCDLLQKGNEIVQTISLYKLDEHHPEARPLDSTAFAFIVRLR